MHIGIHINNTYIAAATIDQTGKTVLIKDDSIDQNKPFMNALKIYVEDEFAYLGNKVDALLSNNYDLNYVEDFLAPLEEVKTPVYTDASGVHWNAAALIAVFLKKIRTDIQIYDDAPIKGAVITINNVVNPALTEAFKQAFGMVKIPLNAVISIERAAVEGYHITNTTHKTRYVLLYYLDHSYLSLSLSTMDEEDRLETMLRTSAKELGVANLKEQLSDFIIKRYEQVTAKKIKAHKKNHMYIHQLIDELMIHMEDDTKLYIPLLCYIDDEIIELIVTRAQISKIIEAYVNETIIFLKNEIFKNTINAETINTILIAGDAKCFVPIEKQLKTLFHQEDQEIYSQYPDEVLVKGAAAYTAHTADVLTDKPLHDTILSSSTSEVKEVQSKKSMDENTIEESPDVLQLSKLVNTMHINAGCEVL